MIKMTKFDARQERQRGAKMNLEKLERYSEEFYREPKRLRQDKWNYADGCVLLAAIQLYRATGRESFKEYVLRYTDHYVTESGEIKTYKPQDFKLDDVLPGRALIFAWEETGEERYRTAAEALLEQLKVQPRTPSGNYWHKKVYPNQVWLDGLFMAMPFRMTWDTRYGKKDQYLDIIRQFEQVRINMRDAESGLYYHGFDESRQAFWANQESGCSKNFWLRAIGWYLLGLADTIEEMDRKVYDFMRPLQDTLKEALQGLTAYRDRGTGLLWQVVDHPEIQGNYLETSGSAMVAAAIFKACRMRLILMEKYEPIAEKILDSLVEKMLVEKDGRLVLDGTCSVAGLGPNPGRRDGSIEYYLSEPIGIDDNKGAAALFMAYAQYLLFKKWEVGVRWKA